MEEIYLKREKSGKPRKRGLRLDFKIRIDELGFLADMMPDLERVW